MSTILSKLNDAEQQRQALPEADTQSFNVDSNHHNNGIVRQLPGKKSIFIVAFVLLVSFYFWIYSNDGESQLESQTIQTTVIKKTQKNNTANTLKTNDIKADETNVDKIMANAFNLEGLLYVADDSSLSKAIINGQSVKQGQYIQPDVRVELISADWLQLNIKGNRVILK